MNAESGQSVSTGAQMAGIIEHKKLSNEIIGLREMQSILQNSGLDVEAKRLDEQINAKEMERKELELRLDAERREMSYAMLLCFCACDIATTCADEFGVVMKRVTKGIYGTDNDFTEAVKEQAESFNKIVQSVDEGGNYALSMFYSDIAEAVNERVLPIMKEIVKDYHNTKLGRRYF